MPRDAQQVRTKSKGAKPRSGKRGTVKPAAATEDSSSEWLDTRASDRARRAASARKSSGRRRFVDPTTCEREYSSDEMEFMSAMQDYKQRSGRMFPTWSEVLEVLGGLGYIKSPSAIYSSAASGGSSNGHDLGRIERRQAATQTPLNGSINADLRPKVACKSR